MSRVEARRVRLYASRHGLHVSSLLLFHVHDFALHLPLTLIFHPLSYCHHHLHLKPSATFITAINHPTLTSFSTTAAAASAATAIATGNPSTPFRSPTRRQCSRPIPLYLDHGYLCPDLVQAYGTLLLHRTLPH